MCVDCFKTAIILKNDDVSYTTMMQTLKYYFTEAMTYACVVFTYGGAACVFAVITIPAHVLGIKYYRAVIGLRFAHYIGAAIMADISKYENELIHEWDSCNFNFDDLDARMCSYYGIKSKIVNMNNFNQICRNDIESTKRAPELFPYPIPKKTKCVHHPHVNNTCIEPLQKSNRPSTCFTCDNTSKMVFRMDRCKCVICRGCLGKQISKTTRGIIICKTFGKISLFIVASIIVMSSEKLENKIRNNVVRKMFCGLTYSIRNVVCLESIWTYIMPTRLPFYL